MDPEERESQDLNQPTSAGTVAAKVTGPMNAGREERVTAMEETDTVAGETQEADLLTTDGVVVDMAVAGEAGAEADHSTTSDPRR